MSAVPSWGSLLSLVGVARPHENAVRSPGPGRRPTNLVEGEVGQDLGQREGRWGAGQRPAAEQPPEQFGEGARPGVDEFAHPREPPMLAGRDALGAPGAV